MRYDVHLKTLHPDQQRAYQCMRANRFMALRAGRRWGKTDFAEVVATEDAGAGRNVGWFTPDYRISVEAYKGLEQSLDPIIASSSQTAGIIRTVTGGRVDFWTLENERAGRSRAYHRIIVDEAAFTKRNMIAIWEQSIRPTLVDYRGKALVMSNTNGVNPDNFFWLICNEPKYMFKDFHAPSENNPYLPRDEVEKFKTENDPLVYQQEYLAEFVDWSGVAFFSLQKLLWGGQPVEYPPVCDAVLVTIDSATKTGKENDGTAAAYWAYSKTPLPGQASLVLLDWDIVQIEGALLEHWLPGVFQNAEALARDCKARSGSIGAFIEDKASGMILIQQAQRKQWPAYAIDSKLTSVGKSERALSVSTYVYRDMVKVSRAAYDKVVVYKGVSRNHMISQVVGFRIGSKDQVDDDCLDAFCYGVAVTLGDSGGF